MAMVEPELEELAPLPAVGQGVRRVAAIDLGTNSTHLLIAAVDPQLRSFSVLLAEKSTTRLGERDPDSGDLTDEAMQRARLALRHCRDLARSHNVEDIICVATSAMREAPNGMAFLAEVEKDLGLSAEVISGAEEARLIYLGVLSGMEFGEQPHQILDIGGGSTELILADARDARALTSSRVGAVRLQRDFVRRDPMDPQRVEFLKAFIQGSMEPSVEKVRRRLQDGEEPILVATSGTAIAAGNLLCAENSRTGGRLHGMQFSKAELDALVKKVLPLGPAQRRQLSGINDRRAEIIVPGLLVLQTAMELLQVNAFVISERALREGLIIDWMLRQGLIVDRFSYQSEIRRRTVLHQAMQQSMQQRESAMQQRENALSRSAATPMLALTAAHVDAEALEQLGANPQPSALQHHPSGSTKSKKKVEIEEDMRRHRHVAHCTQKPCKINCFFRAHTY